MTLDEIKALKIARLNAGLLNIADWCMTRANELHASDTTLTLLEKKVNKLKQQVITAGRNNFTFTK